MEPLLLVGGILATTIYLLLYRLFRKDARLPLPPGPRPLPIVGNIRDLPPPGMPEYQHWLKLKDRYGPISSVTVLGQTMIILHGRREVQDIFDKMSLKTSDRPDMPFGNELCGFNQLLPSQQYDDTFRLYRKMIHQQLGTDKTAARFSHIQDIESRRFLLRVLNKPRGLVKHLATQTSAFILQVTYGYTIEPHDEDPLVRAVDRMMDNFSKAFVPGKWIVDMIPLARHLPEWMPGVKFHKPAREASRHNRLVSDAPFAFVKKQMSTGSHRSSYVSSLIELHNQGTPEDIQLDPDTETAIKWTAAAMYAAAADTTSAAQAAFVVAMVMFPDVQRKAQAEIDMVIPRNRLPELEDREQLPYVSALVRETLRWAPIVPINTAHRTSKEIVYDGYLIPKGALLLASSWWILNDPDTYSDPRCFNPERFLGLHSEPDPDMGAFGYGRRICPGRFMADQSMFITISRLLATFTISKAVDDRGQEMEAELDLTPGLITHPAEFPFEVKPRSQASMDLIRSVEVDHPWERGDAEHLELDGGFV